MLFLQNQQYSSDFHHLWILPKVTLQKACGIHLCGYECFVWLGNLLLKMYVLDYLQGFPEVLRMDQGGRGVGVLYDLPLLLAGPGTKPVLQYKPKVCVCQEPLNLCHTPWGTEVRGTAHSRSQVGDGHASPGLHQCFVGWSRVRCETRLQDGPVTTAFAGLFPPQPGICVPCASWALTSTGFELLVLLAKLKTCQLATSTLIFPNFSASV